MIPASILINYFAASDVTTARERDEKKNKCLFGSRFDLISSQYSISYADRMDESSDIGPLSVSHSYYLCVFVIITNIFIVILERIFFY